METDTQIEESERLAQNAQEQSGSSNNSDDGASSNPASTENSDSTEYTHSTNNAIADGSTITAVDSSIPASRAASNSFLATNANSPPVYLHPSTIPIEEVGYNIHEETTNPRPGQNAISNSFLATNVNSPPVYHQPSTIPIEEVGYIHEDTTNPRPGQNPIGRPPIQESLAWSENDERGPIVPMPVYEHMHQ
jgi:hypothetical protein